MKTYYYLVALLAATLFGSVGLASETRVIINLSDQKACLVQRGRITLVSPIASGKPGWSTPTGNFRIFNKDIDHRSRSFGLVVDAYGRVVNSNATPGVMCPGATIMSPRRCHTSWSSARLLGCMPVTFRDIRHPTDVCECREIWRPCFSSESQLERRLRSLAVQTT
jgi:hypothetical protein